MKSGRQQWLDGAETVRARRARERREVYNDLHPDELVLYRQPETHDICTGTVIGHRRDDVVIRPTMRQDWPDVITFELFIGLARNEIRR